jgi:hypothetical protein
LDDHAPVPAAFYSTAPQGGPQRGAPPPPTPYSNTNTSYGSGSGSGNYKGRKASVAPPIVSVFPSPQNPWTGAIHMYPMMGSRLVAPFYHNPAGVLGPRPVPPCPVPQGYMALPTPSAPAMYTYPDNPSNGSSLAPTLDPFALTNYFNGMTLQAPSDYDMDTGASAHMSSDAGNLSSLSPPRHTHATVDDGSSIPATHSGHATLFTPNSSRSLTLRDVLVTPRSQESHFCTSIYH